MRLGILGGTFNPVHSGHVFLAKSALEQGRLDKLILIPAHIQPFKQDLKPVSGHHRVNMLRLATKELGPNVEISTYELDKGDISYTINTLRAFREFFPLCEKIYFVVGADSFLNICKWKDSEELLKDYGFLVGSRLDYDEVALNRLIDKVETDYGTEIIKVSNKAVDISSTEIRKALEIYGHLEGDREISESIPQEVKDYIIQNEVYN